MMEQLEWTEAKFEASHKGRFADQVHGHLWHVRIYWRAEPIIDARLMHAALVDIVDGWDHTLLDGQVEPTNFGIARAVGVRLAEVVWVEVWREGRVPCGARWCR